MVSKGQSRGRAMFNKFRRQTTQERMVYRTWGERRGGAWVVLKGDGYSATVVSEHASREEMVATLLSK